MKMRQQILEMVQSIEPLDAEEAGYVAFAKKWIESGAGLFRIAKPATPDIHLVSYFALVDQKRNRLLLTDHKKAGLWLPPGGHVEVDEHPTETVRREMREELGVSPDFLFQNPQFLTVSTTIGQDAGHRDVSFWYVLKGSCREAFKYDEGEFHKIQWFLPEEIPYPRTDPHQKRFVEKLKTLNVLE